MDYFQKNSPSKAILSSFPNSDKFSQTNKYNTDGNSYLKLLNPVPKPNVKSIYKSNNQNLHEMNYKNNEYQIKENPKMIKFLTECYSFPFKNLKFNNLSTSKNHINTNNLLIYNK